jgi:hypothetical protein
MEGLGAHPVLDVRKEEQYWKKPYIEWEEGEFEEQEGDIERLVGSEREWWVFQIEEYRLKSNDKLE